VRFSLRGWNGHCGKEVHAAGAIVVSGVCGIRRVWTRVPCSDVIAECKGLTMIRKFFFFAGVLALLSPLAGLPSEEKGGPQSWMNGRWSAQFAWAGREPTVTTMTLAVSGQGVGVILAKRGVIGTFKCDGTNIRGAFGDGTTFWGVVDFHSSVGGRMTGSMIAINHEAGTWVATK
jgi:hypothetical protein